MPAWLFCTGKGALLAGAGGRLADGCCDCGIFRIHSGKASGCTRLEAEIFAGIGRSAPPCCPWSQDGRDCSSINELAENPAGGKNSLSVLGAAIEAGRHAGNFPELPASGMSEFSGLIQAGKVPSSKKSF